MARWSSEEVEVLREYYYDTSKEKLLSKFPSRSWRSIVRKAQREDLSRKRLNENDNVWNENEVPSWFNGELVSDGCITPDGRYAHTTSKKEYVEFLTERFNEENIPVNVTENSYVDSRTNNEYQRWIVRTKSVFKNLRDTWYPDGTKIVPKSFTVDRQCFFHWTLGDGCITDTFILCTEGFDSPSIQRLVEKLAENKIDVNTHENGNLLVRKTKKNKETVKKAMFGNNKQFPACYEYKKERLFSWIG